MIAVAAPHVTRFRSLVTARLGLEIPDDRLDQLTDVLHTRLVASSTATVDAYLATLESGPTGSAELRALADLLTVSETYFFRNVDHFRALVERVLPERLAARGGRRPLRCLSAGCASGEEPYSLAIMLREHWPELRAADVELLGLDLSPANVAAARRARYSAWSLRATSPELRARWFRADRDQLVLDPAIVAMVRVEEGNLIHDAPWSMPPATFDLILCRNVAMYFSADHIRDLIARFERALLPGGYLFLGHAETLRGMSRELELCHTHDTFYYQRRDPAAATASNGRPATGPGPATGPDAEASWVDSIGQASARISALASRGRPPGPLASSVAPTSRPSAPRRPVELETALGLLRDERFDEAIALLAGLTAAAQRDPDVELLRAVLLTNRGDLGEAEATCRRLLAQGDRHGGAHYLIALCREQAGDRLTAIEHDRTATFLEPSFAMPHLHLGLLARRAGDPVAAQRELDRAMKLLASEDSGRILLYGGGFSRAALTELCRNELRAAGGAP